MSGINKVILVGHLGKDPEVRHLDGGVSVASFPLATSETYNKDGRKVEQTEWHNIVMYRKLAEIAGEYLKKGRPVYVEGRLQTRKWEKDGVTRYSTEIVADSMQMLGGKDGGGSNANYDGGMDQNGGNDDFNQSASKLSNSQAAAKQTNNQQSPNKSSGNFDDFEDDIPF